MGDVKKKDPRSSLKICLKQHYSDETKLIDFWTTWRYFKSCGKFGSMKYNRFEDGMRMFLCRATWRHL